MLAAPVLVGGALLSAGALGLALRRLDYERIPAAAVLAAAFFVASLISVPMGPSTVHPILNGLMGLILGWAAIPAVFIGLLLQTFFFGYGGLLVLGVNTFNIAAPALLCALLLGPALRRARGRRVFVLGALAGAVGVVGTGALVASSLALSGPEFVPAARVMILTYLPLMLAEAALTGAAVSFLRRVAPEILAFEAARDAA